MSIPSLLHKQFGRSEWSPQDAYQQLTQFLISPNDFSCEIWFSHLPMLFPNGPLLNFKKEPVKSILEMLLFFFFFKISDYFLVFFPRRVFCIEWILNQFLSTGVTILVWDGKASRDHLIQPCAFIDEETKT